MRFGPWQLRWAMSRRPTQNAKRDVFLLAAVAACFLLSGFAALLYQLSWLRQFSVVFGTSELAVATVLAAYMAGLAVGAAIAGHFVTRINRPVLAYGLLEAGIALSALAVPFLMTGASALYASLLGGQPVPPNATGLGQTLFYLVVSFVVLAVPTGFMGATLPLLARYVVHTNRQVGSRIALLYGINTVGAVMGTVVAAFVLLPALGLRMTVWVGVLVNAVVFLIAAGIARISADSSDIRADDSRAQASIPGFFARCLLPLFAGTESFSQRLRGVFVAQAGWTLPVILASGAIAFFYEVLWTRMLTHVLGGSIYAFATMLAAFLTGIAFGSALAGFLTRNRQWTGSLFAAAQIAIAVTSIVVYQWMESMLPAARGTFEYAVFALLVLLPSTIFIGTTFPLAVRLVAEDETQVGTATARVYAWNTLGAIFGSILAGYFLIPWLGFSGAIKLAACGSLVLAAFTLACIVQFRWQSVAVPVALAVYVIVFYSPQRPDALIASTGFEIANDAPGEELYFAVGRSATVLLTRSGGEFDLRTNGLPEASIVPAGAPPLGQVQHWLTGLPLAARPDARRMLVIGLGGGVALEGVASTVEAIDVVELEPEVLKANQALAGLRATDPLEDQRIRVVLNDARNALRLTSAEYDVIVSQPSHPWTAGASHLFTREFVSLAKSRLTADGVFLQWMSAGFVDEHLLRSLAASLSEVFSNVRLYQTSGSQLMFLASDEPLEIEREVLRTGRPLSDNVLHYSYMGLGSVEDFASALLLDETGLRSFVGGATPSTDDRNLMATESRSLSDGLRAEELNDLLSPFDPLVNADGWLHRDLGRELDFGYITGRLLADGHLGRASRLANAIADTAVQYFAVGLVRGSVGQLEQANEAFVAALELAPANQNIRYALVEPHLAALATGRASDAVIELAQRLSGSALAVVHGWRLAVQRDWQGLAALDPELARAEVTDLWYSDAIRLRADWRIQLDGESRFAFDAIRLIDRALVIQPKLELYLLRAAAADNLNDDNAFVATTRQTVEFVAGRIASAQTGLAPITTEEINVIGQRLVALRARLDRMTPAAAGDAQVVAESVTQQLDELADYARRVAVP